MLSLDVRVQSLLFPECLVAGRVCGTVYFGLMNVFVALQPTVGGEALPASVPIAYVGSLRGWVVVGIFQMSLEVVLTRKALVAARFSADERALLVVASHVGLETTWPVEALFAALDSADVVPLAACLAVCSQTAIYGVIDSVGT